MAKSFLPEPPATTLIAKASNFRPATVEQASALFEIMMRDLMLPLESIMAGWAERLPLYKDMPVNLSQQQAGPGYVPYRH